MKKLINETIKSDRCSLLLNFYKMINNKVYVYPECEYANYVKNKIIEIHPTAHVHICSEEEPQELLRDVIFKESILIIIATEKEDCYINWHYQSFGINPQNIYMKKTFEYILRLIDDKIIDKNQFLESEYSQYILNNLSKCETVYKNIEDEHSKSIYLKTIAKYMDGNIFFSDIMSSKVQYFDSSIIKLRDGEVFVDGGSHVGETINNFIKQCPNYNMIYAFEPNPDDFKDLIHNQSDSTNISFFNVGLGDENGLHKFLLLDLGSSTFKKKSLTYPLETCNTKSILRHVIRGDDLMIKPTMIKMDIEGYELNALNGFSNTIINCKPKMAVSVYHNISDLWEIPLFLKNIRNDYKFFFRHYSSGFTETVCYAI